MPVPRDAPSESERAPFGWTPDGDIVFCVVRHERTTRRRPALHGRRGRRASREAAGPVRVERGHQRRRRVARLHAVRDATSRPGSATWADARPTCGSSTSGTTRRRGSPTGTARTRIPMWHGDKLYYAVGRGLASPPEHLGLRRGDREARQVTKHGDYDVKWPSIGPGRGRARSSTSSAPSSVCSTSDSERSTRRRGHGYPATTPGASADLRRVRADRRRRRVRDRHACRREARGDIWTLPAENGTPQNLTRTNGVAERHPRGAPTASGSRTRPTRSGSTRSTSRSRTASGETKKLTSRNGGYLEGLTWSPDSEKIAFFDSSGTLYIHDIESKRITKAYKRPTGSRRQRQLVARLQLAHLRRHAVGPQGQLGRYLYNVDKDELHQVTSGMFADTWPTFDRDGRLPVLREPDATSARSVRRQHDVLGLRARPTVCSSCRSARTSSRRSS